MGVDLIQTHGWDQQRHFWFSVYCWSVSFQTVEVLQGNDSMTPANAWNTFVDSWARHFGYPDVLICGPGEPLEGYFREQANREGICVPHSSYSSHTAPPMRLGNLDVSDAPQWIGNSISTGRSDEDVRSTTRNGESLVSSVVRCGTDSTWVTHLLLCSDFLF